MEEENPNREQSGPAAPQESHRRKRRRLKLVDLLKLKGGAAKVAEDTGIERTYLIALETGRRGVGDRIAQRLEDFYGLGLGWFDAPPEKASDWPFKRVSLKRVTALDPDDLLRLEGRLAEAMDWVTSTSQEQADSEHHAQIEREAREAREDALARGSEFDFKSSPAGDSRTDKTR